MNHRSKRLTVGVMAVGLAVVLVVAIAYRKAILEHVEAWHFQLTTKTEKIGPTLAAQRDEARNRGARGTPQFDDYHFDNQSFYTFLGSEAWYLLSLLSSSEVSVIVDSRHRDTKIWWAGGEPTPLGPVALCPSTPDQVRRILVANGWRVLDQRLPCRAFVVVPGSVQTGLKEAQSRVEADIASTVLDLKVSPR